jgi:hypothetical protein
MKKIIILISLFNVSLQSFSQTITFRDLVFVMNDIEIENIDTYLSYKGFKIGEIDNEGEFCKKFEWNYENKELVISKIQRIQKTCDSNYKIVTYSSTNSKNYLQIKNELIQLGYKKNGENYNGGMLNSFYQKGKNKFQLGKKNIDEITQYLVIYRVVK